MNRLFKISLLLLLPAFILSSCGEIKRGEYVKGAASIYCDDGFRNILEEEIDVFESQYRESSIIPTYVSEEDAVDALMADKTDAIIITHELDKARINQIRNDYKKVVKQKAIAVDAVALIVNKDNPLDELSMEEIGRLMKGDINKWTQLVVNDTSYIKLVFDNQGSSTVNFMRDKFNDGKPLSNNPNVHVFAQKNNAEVFDIVKKDPAAIGIISVSWLGDTLQYARKVPAEQRYANYENTNDTVAVNLTTEVKVLKVSNPTELNDFSSASYKPYQAYISTGEYPLFRTVYMVTTGSNSSLMKSFYDFVTGFVGQKIISLTGILPYHLNQRVVELK